jgi:hypothetical protein
MLGRVAVVIFVLTATVATSETRSQTVEICPDGTLWEPYSGLCAEVRDKQHEFLPQPTDKISRNTLTHDAPVPGSMSAGTRYVRNQLTANDSGRLHTRMFVYPEGLETDGPLPNWFYTTATCRAQGGLELVGMYATWHDVSYLGLFAWPCLPDYPCPDGDTSSGWQWWRRMPELTCNITQIVDQGGHAQKQLYYANHSDRLDDGSPPLWRSAVYLWNYCDGAWDLAWEHTYREDKQDCSVSGCAWWGPVVELFGDTVYPHIGEIDYEDSLLFHDGVWSLLAAPEAEFIDPSVGRLTPWQVFHLDPNRSWTVGNWVNENDPPVIDDQAPLETPEDQTLELNAERLTIKATDIDPRFHVDFQVTIYGGENYTYSGNQLTPDLNFSGALIVPITVSDGAADSETFELHVSVIPINDAPEIRLAGESVITLDGGAVFIDPGAIADDPEDGDISGNIVVGGDTVDTNAAGTYVITYNVTDSDGLAAAEVSRTVIVEIDEPPVITLIGSAMLVLTVGDTYTEQGATAQDTEDGDLTDKITINNPIDTRTPGTYTVTYSVEDSAGQQAQAKRTVLVEPAPVDQPPTIALRGEATVTLTQGDSYTDAGATANDPEDGDLTDQIMIDNPVDTATPATYTVTYTVEDSGGNQVQTERTVIVEEAPPQPPPQTRGGGGGGPVSPLELLASTMLLLAFLGSQQRSALGRKRPFKLDSLRASECPVLVRADIRPG